MTNGLLTCNSSRAGHVHESPIQYKHSYKFYIWICMGDFPLPCFIASFIARNGPVSVSEFPGRRWRRIFRGSCGCWTFSSTGSGAWLVGRESPGCWCVLRLCWKIGWSNDQCANSTKLKFDLNDGFDIYDYITWLRSGLPLKESTIEPCTLFLLTPCPKILPAGSTSALPSSCWVWAKALSRFIPMWLYGTNTQILDLCTTY